MTDIVKTLSAAEVTADIADASKISANTVNVASPKTFIFNAGFDGTNNIKTDLSVSQDKQSTAIGALTDAIPNTANSATKYYAGMGTPSTLPGSSVNPTQGKRGHRGKGVRSFIIIFRDHVQNSG